MDLDTLEGLNVIRPSVYRAAMKLLSLQRRCHLDVVSVHHIMAAVSSLGGALWQDVGLDRERVTWTLNRMFHGASQEVLSHVTLEETCSLIFRLYDRSQMGSVSAASLQTALIALCSDTLQDKYTALVRVSGSGSISRSGLRFLLQDLSQVPLAVQEEVVLGDVEAALRSCFHGMFTPTVTEDHVLSWLQSEPCLLLWLPTLYRLSISQNICHSVRCHTCKAMPITGLRYRCVKCVNVHVCQSCFWTERQTRKHKVHHPMLEFCTQPNWRESLSSLAHKARHILFARRYTQRAADRRRVLTWAEPGEKQNSAPPPSDSSTRLANSAVCHSPSHDATMQSSSPSSEVLQTEEQTPPQQVSTLLDDIRSLKRDQWLLEQEIQGWRLAVQSEQGVLEDRCSEMEVSMETLRKHTLCLQGKLTQALNEMETQQHADSTPHITAMEKMDNVTPTSDIQTNTVEEEEEEEEEVLVKDEWSKDDQQTSSLTIHPSLPSSHDICCVGGVSGDMCPIEQELRLKEAGLQDDNVCLSKEEEDCGMCSLEELLQETIDRLKTVLETDRWREQETGERRRVELLEAAEQVGDSVHHLVDAVRTNAH